MRCWRCCGLMVGERFYGPGNPFWGWRCVCCGEILDPIISENRNQCATLALERKGISARAKTEELRRYGGALEEGEALRYRWPGPVSNFS